MYTDRRLLVVGILSILILSTAYISGCSGLSSEADKSLTVYSGRSRELIRPVLQRFEKETDIQVSVRYGNTAELAATILEEGQHSPADVFFAQDAGGLGALASAQRLVRLPQRLLDSVSPSFLSQKGAWVGISGRARVVAYNTDNVSPEQLPDSLLDFTDTAWRGRVGWAPMNASFQSSVTAMRKQLGKQKTGQWLQDLQATLQLMRQSGVLD